MTDSEVYGTTGVSEPGNIGYSPFSGPVRPDVSVTLAEATSDAYTIGTDPTYLCGLTWTPTDSERVDAGIRLAGVASGDMNISVGFVHGDAHTVWRSFLTQAKGGANTLISFPWVLKDAPVLTERWQVRLNTSSGTFVIPAGGCSWFLARLG